MNGPTLEIAAAAVLAWLGLTRLSRAMWQVEEAAPQVRILG